jgi:hypothetical protein
MKTLINTTILVFTFVFAAYAGPASDEAVRSAEAWLKLVDTARYDKSWDTAASYFKSRVKKETWSEMVHSVRSPFGAVIKRKLKSANFTKSLPGAPDGEYVVIQFATSFDNKKKSVETITPMKDTDGQWRVSGYYIR